MKRKYAFSIFGVAFLMLSSVGIYTARIINKSGININEFILNSIYSIDSSQTSEDEQVTMDSSFSYGSYINSEVAKNSINTTTGYSGLTSISEKKCYTLIKTNAYKILNSQPQPGFYSIEPITVADCRLNSTQIKKVLYAIQNDNPDIFWIGSYFSYCYSGNKTIIKLNSIFSAHELQTAIKKLNDKVNLILSKAPKNADDYETELYFHDYIVNNCKYKYTNSLTNQNLKVFTSYGCLVENSAVCEGFSKAMQLLMNSVGIKCRTVVGARGSEPHMWNIVKINNNWYHLDVTWDGSGNYNQYNYFNLTDEMIKKDHQINAELRKTTKFSDNIRYNFKMPVCNSTTENYYEKNAVKVKKFDAQTDSALIQELIKAARLKKEYFYIKVQDNISLETAKNTFFSQRPYKYFSCIKSANNSLPYGNKLNSREAHYSENKFQNVLIIKLSYN